jgi:cytoskeletal protein RodZ
MELESAESTMDLENFGTFLRKQREARGLSLTQLSRATKIKESNLVALEAARLDQLPARVFVVGYVGAYARAVGADVGEALARLKLVSPASTLQLGACMPKVVARAPEVYDGEGRAMPERRRVGVALVVFLLLIVATLTLSLLLRHGGHVGGPLS